PPVENELKSQRIPYQVIGGLKFYERKEIKDALAYLVAISNPRDDEAVRRILNTPARGIGAKTELKIAQLARNKDISFQQALLNISELGLGPKLTAAIESFTELLSSLRDQLDIEQPAKILEQVLTGSGYKTQLENSRDPQDEARVENLDALIGQVYDYQAQNPEGSLSDYLADVTLATATDDLDEESGSVSLMTLHTAKGLEYPVVFLIGLEQGTLPHVRAFDEPGGLAEERRLMYVGMTRAKQKLVLSCALTRTLFGSQQSMMASSFLGDIPEELIDTVGERRSAASAPKPISKWQGAITTPAQIRDNDDLQLVAGDRINHDSFGEGEVIQVNGNPPRQTAEIRFDSGQIKKLMVKVAPIQVLK
ncbi:MAG TPA: 3'-5' exonuclease, partial [Microbacteriaceae bacterium]